ncbi:MAG: Crp/Fnr family transcriptional regulator [Ruminococcaceae bacterium]|nr:Crp/Fnr family transcriptional regulator [Oscillospiraceae bacterium]
MYQMRHFFGGTMKEAVSQVLETCPLFRGCDRSKIELLLEQSRALRYPFSPGDEFFTENAGERRIGILLFGALTVYAPGEENTPLNRLKPGGLFGVSALFGSPGANTVVRAESEGELLFIGEEQAEVLWEDKCVRSNLISFLTDRICFLNRKIASFTAKGAEGKLVRYLSQCADASGKCKIDSSFSELAKSLHLGRASLYRALDKLETEGVIRREKKEILLLSPETV